MAAVSSGKIVEHNFAKKRQQVGPAAAKKQKKEEESSLLFTDEDIQKMSREYFLHSKAVKPKFDSWKD